MTISSSARRRTDLLAALAAIAAFATATGCGGDRASGDAPGAEGTSGGDDAPRIESTEGVELTVRTPSGEWIYVGDLRGQPVLLVFVATYDGVSQAALVPLRRFAGAREDVHVVGVLVQQEADALVDAWVHALDPPFPVGYDPEGTLADADGPLGAIETVPTFVALDANGVVVERRVGYQGERALHEMADAARAHAPVGRRAPPPLLGTPRAR